MSSELFLRCSAVFPAVFDTFLTPVATAGECLKSLSDEVVSFCGCCACDLSEGAKR